MTETTRRQAEQSFFVYVKDTNTGTIKKLVVPAGMQVGLKGRPTELQVLGRLSLSAKTLAATRKNQGYVFVTNDMSLANVTVESTPASNVVTVKLPLNPKDGQIHFIKDASGVAASVLISIVPAGSELIDNTSSYSLVDNDACVGVYFHDGAWHVLSTSGVTSGGGGGAPTNATYLTLSNNSTLTNERRLSTSGSNITLVDNGANSTAVIDLSSILGGGAGTFTYSTITVDAYGRITAASSGTPPPGATASYITVNNEASLANERALAAGTGLLLSDGGAGSSITTSINNNVVATITGSNFSGPVTATGGLSGSLQRLASGLTYLVAGPNITITSGTNGQVLITAASSGGSDAVWVDGGNRARTTSSIAIDSSGGFASNVGTDVYFFVSGTIGLFGSTARNSVFGGDAVVSGSITLINDLNFGDSGTRIERVGSNMLFYDANNPTGYTLSQLALTGSGGSGSFDPTQSVITSASFINVTPTFSSQVFAVSLKTSGTAATTSGSIIYSTTLADNQFLDFEAEVIGANMRGYRRVKIQRSMMRFDSTASVLSSDQAKTEILTNYRGGDNEPLAIWTENLRFFSTGSNSVAQLEVTGSGIIDWTAYVSLNRQLTFTSSLSSSLPDAPLTYIQYVLAWYRSDDITISGSNVQRVNDKSGNGRHLSQGTTTDQPTLELATSTFNGHNTWNTDGVTQHLSGTIWNLGGASGIGYTIFTVFMNTSPAGNFGVWDLSTSTLTNTYAHFIFNAGPQIRYSGSAFMTWTLTPSEDASTYHTVSIATGSWERSEVWVKGVSVSSTTTTPSGKPINIRVGRLFQDVFPFPGKYAEIIICSGTLPAAGRQTIDAYLSARYNIV